MNVQCPECHHTGGLEVMSRRKLRHRARVAGVDLLPSLPAGGAITWWWCRFCQNGGAVLRVDVSGDVLKTEPPARRAAPRTRRRPPPRTGAR